MWLAMHLPPETEERAARERFFETLLGISPDVFFGPTKAATALVSLRAVTRYWKLATLASSTPPPTQRTEDLAASPKAPPCLERFAEASVHPFLKKLSRNTFGASVYVQAPTPSLALALLSLSCENALDLRSFGRHFAISAKRSLYWYTAADLAQTFSSMPPEVLLHIVPDFSNSQKNNFEYFFENAAELGLFRLEQILALMRNPTEESFFLERFGPHVLQAFKRLRGQDRMKLEAFVPPKELRFHFFPQFEKESSSNKHEDLKDRLLEIWRDWEDQLRLRKASLQGLELVIKAPRPIGERKIELSFARPLRNAEKIFKVLQEKILSRDQVSAKSEHFTFDIFDEISLRSLGLAEEQDKQLSLFDPRKEESLEDWSLLVSEIKSIHPQIKIGHYAAFESYFPEHSIEWVPWREDEHAIKNVLEHPPRPERLLNKIQPYKKKLASETEFLEYLRAQNALHSLERIRNPWKNAERSYARVGYDWIFWEHHAQKCFVHGIFEEQKNSALD